ncbi:hypothetical protein [Kitasatospora sp. NPDC092286]|uniref:hypothetical protein n=1 Tax=Kitasatospora sp. NPDC092286 TaxID=3364087 RepID=UPI00380CB56A
MAESVALLDAVGDVLAAWHLDTERGALSVQSLDKFGLLIGRFSRFAAANGVELVGEVSEALADDFIHARGRTRHGRIDDVSLSTRHLRRSVLRMFFRAARQLGLADNDPTWSIELPPRTGQSARPLTTEEAACCRLFAESTADRTRHAAVAALALAGANTGEIGHICGTDLDLEANRVWVHGSSKTDERWCALDAWSKNILVLRIHQLAGRYPASRRREPLATSRHGSDAQRQARACVALRDVLVQAGLGRESDLKPASVTAHAGLTAFTASGRIEDAARLLGLRSLDRAAAVIGHHWRDGSG